MAYWMERLGIGLLFAGLVALVALFEFIDGRLLGLFALGWVGLLAWLIRSGSMPLFGPVLSYDLIRIGRRPTNFRMRVLFVLLLGGTAGFLYYMQTYEWRSDLQGGAIPLKKQAQFGQTLFYYVIFLQYILIIVLTPGYVAGAIAEEKERGTLEFLLATDLRGHEIVFGKLASRVANVLMFVLAGLPVLGIALMFGGVDPNVLMVCYAATIETILSLAALSIFASVRKRRARDAIGLAYLVVILYIVGSFVPFLLINGPTKMTMSLDILGWQFYPFDWANAFAAGNPLWQIPYYNYLTRMGGSPQVLFDRFRAYTYFHALMVALFLGYSGWRMRALALAQMHGPARQGWKLLRKRRERKPPPHPPVGERPMLWKELYVLGSGRNRARGWQGVLGIFLMSWIAPVGFYLDTIYFPSPFGNESFPDRLQMYTRLAGILLVSLLYLRIAIRGAGCISGERDQHTLDELLTTPLTTVQILLDKWIGCVLSMRNHWLFLIFTWITAAACDALHWLMVPALIGTALVYATAFAGIGILFSLTARTTNRAILGAIAASLLLGGGINLIFTVMLAAVSDSWFLGYRSRDLTEFFAAFSPPIATFFLTMRQFTPNWRNLHSVSQNEHAFIVALILGLICWLAITLVLRRLVFRRFARLANRLPYTPEVLPAAKAV